MPRLVVCLILLVPCAITQAEPTVLEKPLYAEVYLPSAGARLTKVSGNVTRYDDKQFTLQIVKEERTLTWNQITPNSAFTLRQRLIDKTKATDWLELGRFGWEIGASDQARVAFRQAVKIDASLQKSVDQILSKPPSDTQANQDDAKPQAPDKPAENAKDDDLIKQSGDPAPVAQPGRKQGEKIERQKFTPATPEQAEDAIKRIREQQTEIATAIKVTLVELETDHFIIFTDWDPREQAFLKKNLEEAYRVVSKQFEMSPKDNIFVGKLPVYMFSKYGDFAAFADLVDQFPVSRTTAGYYHGNSHGFGHMAMWKPDESLTRSRDIKDAERLWAYVLVHEFTHAFLARYRSNEFVPRWLNEGIAEVIASSEFPRPGWVSYARRMAASNLDVNAVFDDSFIPDGQYYPVMHSMVQLLVVTDRKKFINLIDDIKDGKDPEETLRTHFNTDYARFAAAWREWAKKQNGQ